MWSGSVPCRRPMCAALVQADALTAIKDLDRARGDAHIDLGADERVRDRIEKVVDLDVIVEIDARAPPFGEFPILLGQGRERFALDLLEQLATADAEFTHRPAVHALHDERDGLVAFGEREEGLTPQSPENVGLRKPHAGFDFRFVARLSRARRQDADAVMRRHRAIGSVDLGVVERRLVDAALEIVGNQQLRHAAEEAEHAHMRPGPVRQLSASRSPRHRSGSRRRARRRKSPPRGFRPWWDRRCRSACPNSRRTPCRPRHDAGASPASAAARTREADRRTGCSHSPPDGPRDIPPRGSSSSTPGRFSSRARSAQSGSTRRRWPVVDAGARK